MKRFLTSICLILFVVVCLVMLFDQKVYMKKVFETDLKLDVEFNVAQNHLFYFEGSKYRVHLIGIDEIIVLNDEKTLKELLEENELYMETFLSKLELIVKDRYRLDVDGGSFSVDKCDRDIYLVNGKSLILNNLCENSYSLKAFGEVTNVGEKTTVLLREKIIDLETLEIPNGNYKVGDLVMIYYTMKNKPIVEIKDVIHYDFDQYKLEDFGIKMDMEYSFILKDIDFNLEEDYYEYYEEYMKKCDCMPISRKNKDVKIYLPTDASISSVGTGYYDSLDYLKKGQVVTFQMKEEKPVFVMIRLKNNDSIIVAI